MFSESFKELTRVIEENKKMEGTKEERDAAFWNAAVTCFNEDIAGEITTCTGTKLYTPPIEI